MNKGTFSYALLQYHHSQVLGEVLNIGMIIYFPEHKKIEFIYPEKLIRLRFAYPDFPEKTIRSYFKYFQAKTDEINSQSYFPSQILDHSLRLFLEKEFLAPDSSALQFGNFRNSVLYSQDLDVIKNQLFNLYFSVFQQYDNPIKKIDESALLKKYRGFLEQLLPKDISLRDSDSLFIDYSIKPNTSSEVKFDVAWKQNEKLHLVKPVSFDLVRPDSILKKAYQYFGQFEDLQDYAKANHYQFDVILAKPKQKNLISAYDNAIRLLEKPERVKLIEQDELKGYSQETIAATLSN